MKVMCVIGTRPEAIKLAPVIIKMFGLPEFEPIVVVTAQHRELLDGVLNLFQIKPDVDLNLMRSNQSPTAVAAAVLSNIEPVLEAYLPDWVLVQGDTTSALAAAIAAHYKKIRVGHVEAGLRSYDRLNPFPEETNRTIISCVADLHFAPTRVAQDNLIREGIKPRCIVVTGNTVIDALLQVSQRRWAPGPSSPLFTLPQDRVWLLVTAHRRENFGQPLKNICVALLRLADRGDLQVIYPVHPNPNIDGPVHEMLGNHPAILLLPPLDYQPFVWLLAKCKIVLTDSGGLQEEAPSLGKPVLVLRKTTERLEAVQAGTAQLVGTEPERIVSAVSQLIENQAAYDAMAQTSNPYGDGHAADHILAALRNARNIDENNND